MALVLTAALLTPFTGPQYPYCAETLTRAGLPVEWCDKEQPEPEFPTSGVERWRPMVEYFWDEPHTSRMMKILKCESGGNPRAYNGRTGVRGLFQIHPLWQKPWPGDYYDPWTNAAVAYQIWLEQGYRAWSCKG